MRIYIIFIFLAQLVDIVETVIKNGNFKTLVQALNVSSQMSFLKNVGPLTVFAQMMQLLPSYRQSYSNVYSDPKVTLN